MSELVELYGENIANKIHLNIVKVFRANNLLYSGLCQVNKNETFTIHTKYKIVTLELNDIKKVVDTGRSTYIQII